MRRSPSVLADRRNGFRALKRVFLLPDFEVPRAALVIERYLETLRRNSLAYGTGATPILERSCYVPAIGTKWIAPILRDIKDRGTAFMDSADGYIEAHRARAPQGKRVSELGVLVFAWTAGPKKPKQVAAGKRAR
jgi:hypothetical protein